MSHPLTRRSFAKAMGFSLAGSGWASSWGCLPESPPSPAPSGAGTLSMTTGPPDVAIPPDQPADEIWRYGLTFPFQVSSDTAAIFCNLRGQSGHDFEIGTDVFLFRNLSGLQEREAIPISRNHEETNPHSDPPGRPAIMVKYPVRGGFVPLGALLEDGSPHPHAGTGFGCSQVIAWTPDRKGVYPEDQREDYMEVYQLAYDGRRFEVTATARLRFGRLLDGAVLSNPGITTAIPDGEDLLFAMGGQIEQARGSGLTRWRRGQEGWRPVSWTPITGPDNAFEPSVVRDRDDKLLFCARGGRAPDYNDVRVWQSTGADAPWKKVIHVRGVVSTAPIAINTSRSGDPYVASNLYSVLEEPMVPGHRYPRDEQGNTRLGGWLRERLAFWPLDQERRGLETPLLVRHCAGDFGPAPSGFTWGVDHPSAHTVRLADGQWHDVIGMRICDLGEVLRGEAPSPHTGAYLEEVLTGGESRPRWRF